MNNRYTSLLGNFLTVISVAGLLQSTGLAASLEVYISAPTEQETYVQGAQTETFNSLTSGTTSGTYQSSIGTYTFTNAVVAPANQYGGANSSQYINIGAPTDSAVPFTLNLNQEANYFGFWWSAGDDKNEITFFYDDTELASFSTKDILTLLGNRETGSVTAVNQTTYESLDYFGNPNPHPLDEKMEPFAYVHIFSIGLKFNKIVFSNSGSTGTGFESDNHSVHNFAEVPEPEGSTVFVKEVPTTAVPEPSTTVLLVAAGGAMLHQLVRRRKQAKA